MISTQSNTQDTPKGDLRRAKITAISAQQDEYADLLPYLTYQEQEELDRLLSNVYMPLWEPFEGPQTVALSCEADELFYGGAAGGGKTDLLLGVALTQHWRSIIFRREYAELKGIRERADELLEDIGRFNGQQEIWRITEGEFKGARIEFGACQYEGDERKFSGRPHDLKGFDEVTQFTEHQFRFLITWNRTVRHGQRTRVIATGNPPVNAEGQWVIKYWAPWLDPKHPNPARQGELRWFITDEDGNDREVGSPEPVEITYEDGTTDLVYPKSRTFIRARVEDNPRLMESGYRRTLQNLPEPLRSRMLRGDFGVGIEDDEWQVIPTDWVLQAQARWAPTFEEFLVKQATRHRDHEAQVSTRVDETLADETHGFAGPTSLPFPSANGETTASKPSGTPNTSRGAGPEPEMPRSLLGKGGTVNAVYVQRMQEREGKRKPLPPLPRDSQALRERREQAEKSGAIGVDVSRGGRDASIVSERLENWFAELVTISGKYTKDGLEVIKSLVDLGLHNRRIHIDVTGVGTSPTDIGKMYEMNVVPMIGAEKSRAKDRSGKLSFCNLRTQWHWKMREALDPALGDDIALPPDPELLADLTSPRWQLTPRGILVESKEQIKKRLGRSPDKGDAVVMAHAEPYIVGEGYLQYLETQVKEKEELEREASSRGGRGQAPQKQMASIAEAYAHVNRPINIP